MSEENQQSDHDAIRQLYDFVATEMQAGSDKMTIARKLEEQGVDLHEAEQTIGAIYDEISAMVRKEQFSGSAIVPGLLGGLLGAVLGGGVWAGIVILTDYELGVIAWAIGGVCGARCRHYGLADPKGQRYQHRIVPVSGANHPRLTGCTAGCPIIHDNDPIHFCTVVAEALVSARQAASGYWPLCDVHPGRERTSAMDAKAAGHRIWPIMSV